MGDSIPYYFYDVASFSDLYFSSDYKKLIAVTLYSSNSNNSITTVKVYTLDFPPNPPSAENIPATAKTKNVYVIISVTLSIIIICLFLLYLKRKRKKKLQEKEEQSTSALTDDLTEFIPADESDTDTEQSEKNLIYLFGSFEMFSKEREDLTHLFTPLLKEMFLLIIIYSLKNKTGVSSSRLYSTLWNDKSNKDAQINRSVNMVKLKGILNKMGTVSIVKEADRWHMQYDQNDIYIDLEEFIDITEKKKYNTKQNIYRLLAIIKRGGFLSGTEYAWLDDIKSDIASCIIDILHEATVLFSSDLELLIEIANGIFFFDPANEEALHIKCKTLNLLGRHSLAKSAYDKFLKDYYHMYGENYKLSFNDVIQGKDIKV